MKTKCKGCKERKEIHGVGFCNNCYQKNRRFKKRGIDFRTALKMDLFKTTGTDGTFQKGRTPWNEDLKKPYSKDAKAKMSGAWFLVGNIPWNKGIKSSKKYSDRYKDNGGSFQSGENHPNWRGGKRNHHKYRAEVEKTLNRSLLPNEVVHHIDANSLNNSLSNLLIFQNHSEHMKYHWKLHRERKEKGKLKKLAGSGTN